MIVGSRKYAENSYSEREAVNDRRLTRSLPAESSRIGESVNRLNQLKPTEISIHDGEANGCQTRSIQEKPGSSSASTAASTRPKGGHMTIRQYMVITFVSLLAQAAMVEPCFATSKADEQDRPSESSWEKLRQVRVGQKIEVVDTTMKAMQGNFLGLSDEAITIQHKNNPVSVPRSNVVRVSSREDSKRLRNALIGLAIGGAAGIGVAAAVGKDDPEAQAVYRLIAVPVGLGVGGGLGAAFPGFQTIYRAQPQKAKKGP